MPNDKYWAERTLKMAGERIELLSPRDVRERGCQVSLRVRERPRELLAQLKQEGVVLDFREPDALRLAPVPLYNSFHDVWRFGRALERWVGDSREPE